MKFAVRCVRKFEVVLLLAGLVIGLGASGANAGVVRQTNGTISMKAGARAGLQRVFAWDSNCRAVRTTFRGRASAGSVFTVGGSFRIGSGKCAGRRVSGFTVVYKAPSRVKGTAVVRYGLKPANMRDVYVFTRKMIIR